MGRGVGVCCIRSACGKLQRWRCGWCWSTCPATGHSADERCPLIVAEFLTSGFVEGDDSHLDCYTFAPIDDVYNLGSRVKGCARELDGEWAVLFQVVFAVDVIVGLEVWEEGRHGLGDFAHHVDHSEGGEGGEDVK